LRDFALEISKEEEKIVSFLKLCEGEKDLCVFFFSCPPQKAFFLLKPCS